MERRSHYIKSISKNPNQPLWSYDRRGNYSIKSKYQVAFRLKTPDYPRPSKSSMTEWNAIWKLVLLEKMKIFMWRAAQNLLPIVENLWKKNKILQQP